MKYEPKTVALRDGSAARFRSPEPEDADVFLDFFTAVRGETDFLLSCPQDPALTPEEERAWIENSLRSPDLMMIVCEMDGRLVYTYPPLD